MLNRVVLMGRLTTQPELKTTPSGVAVTSFSIAVDRPGKEKVADFISVVAWRSSAEFVCRYFGKGDPITVEGRIQVRNYTTQEGQKRNVVEVVADQVGFVLSSKKESGAGAAQGTAAEEAAVEASADEFVDMMGEEDMPF